MAKKLIMLSDKSFWRMRSCGHTECYKCGRQLKRSDLVIRCTGKAGKVKYYHDDCFVEY